MEATMVKPPEVRLLEMADPSIQINFRDHGDAVFVTDMQNDFVHPDGKLYSPGSEKTAVRLAQWLDPLPGPQKFWSRDWHRRNHSSFSIWGPHCIQGSWGAQIHEALEPQSRHGQIVNKGIFEG